MDMSFCLRQLQGKYLEQDRPVYIVFADFTKAFDNRLEDCTVADSEELWTPKRFTTLIESLYTGMMLNVMTGGKVSDTFVITIRCVLAHTLFSIFLSAMLEEAFRDI